jgi:hypothetical protein
MKRIAIALWIACALLTSTAGAQKKMKPWTQWSEKDAKKILENSPWAQTQVQTDTSQMFYRDLQGTLTPGAPASESPDMLNQAVSVNYHIRFLSAKPVRQAFARVVELEQKNADPRLLKGLRDFVDRKFDQWIVVAVTFDSKDQRYSMPAMQLFNSAVLSTLKNNTYLELKNGKRLFIEDYKAPINDGLGAKFIFPRMVDGQPFITAESGEVRFYSELPVPGDQSGSSSKSLILTMRFKVADFMYEGALEY